VGVQAAMVRTASTASGAEKRMSTARGTVSAAGNGAVALKAPLTTEALRHVDAYWRAANHLSVGQIYLLANPLRTSASMRPEIRDWTWPASVA